MIFIEQKTIMSKNKFESVYIDKKWKNKHNVKYSLNRSSYGCWWTPPMTKNEKKDRKKDKKIFVKHELNEWIEMGWIDYELTREYDEFQEPIRKQSMEGDVNNWICQTCSMEHSDEFQFCQQCNTHYYGYQQNQYVQYYAIKKSKNPKEENKVKIKKDQSFRAKRDQNLMVITLI